MGTMFDFESLARKVGGPFYLTVLIQKRLKELRTEAKRTGIQQKNNLWEIVCREIQEEKLHLTPEEIPEQAPQEQDIFNQADYDLD